MEFSISLKIWFRNSWSEVTSVFSTKSVIIIKINVIIRVILLIHFLVIAKFIKEDEQISSMWLLVMIDNTSSHSAKIARARWKVRI